LHPVVNILHPNLQISDFAIARAIETNGFREPTI